MLLHARDRFDELTKEITLVAVISPSSMLLSIQATYGAA
jgi:hypothetical protein